MPPESLMQAWARMYRPNSPNHLCHKFTLPLLQIYRRKEPCPAVPVSFFTGCIQMSLQTGLGLQLSKNFPAIHSVDGRQVSLQKEQPQPLFTVCH